MVVTYYMQYIKLYRMGADRHNSILLSLLRLVAETKQKYLHTTLGLKIKTEMLWVLFRTLGPKIKT